MFGHWEILAVVAIFALLFGSAKLPKLFNNMGRSINEFKAGMQHKPEGLENDSTKKELKEEEEEVVNR